jgi:hypothetical protein
MPPLASNMTWYKECYILDYDDALFIITVVKTLNITWYGRSRYSVCPSVSYWHATSSLLLHPFPKELKSLLLQRYSNRSYWSVIVRSECVHFHKSIECTLWLFCKKLVTWMQIHVILSAIAQLHIIIDIFMDIAPCCACVNRRFGGMCHLNFHCRKTT